MKILIVTPYRNYSGGVESVNGQLDAIFRELGHEVFFLTTDGSSYKGWFQLKIIGLPSITRFEYKKLEDHFDLIICNGEFGFGIQHNNAINIFHGSYYGLRKNLNRYLTLRQKISMTIADHIQRQSSHKKLVVSVSSYLSSILCKQGIRVNTTIENMVDDSIFYPINNNTKSGLFLFVGQNHFYNKGIDLLLRYASMYDQTINCVTDATDKVEGLNFIGQFDHRAMNRIYNDHKILLFLSRFESSGLVAIEAMACGVPVIMFNVGIGYNLIKSIPEFVIDLNCKDTILEIDIRKEKILSNYNHYSELSLEYVKTNHNKKLFIQKWASLLNEVTSDKI